MISKNELKYIQSLYHKKARDESGLFVAEGIKLVDELVNSNMVIKKIYAVQEWAAAHTVPVTVVEAFELEKMSGLSTPGQVLALAAQKELPPAPVEKGQLILALDGIQDPGNLGTIIRIADWFGITQLVATTDTADLYNPKVIRSTMGSITRVNMWYKNLEQWLADATIPVYGALLAGQSIYEMPPLKEGILLIGNESKGIRQNLLPFVQHPVTIPGNGSAESLNAAVAAGIILSHLVRNK